MAQLENNPGCDCCGDAQCTCAKLFETCGSCGQFLNATKVLLHIPTGFGNSSCSDCADFNGDFELCRVSSCRWETSTTGPCQSAPTWSFYYSSGDTTWYATSADGTIYSVANASMDCRATTTMTRTGTSSDCTSPTTITVDWCIRCQACTTGTMPSTVEVEFTGATNAQNFTDGYGTIRNCSCSGCTAGCEACSYMNTTTFVLDPDGGQSVFDEFGVDYTYLLGQTDNQCIYSTTWTGGPGCSPCCTGGDTGIVVSEYCPQCQTACDCEGKNGTLTWACHRWGLLYAISEDDTVARPNYKLLLIEGYECPGYTVPIKINWKRQLWEHVPTSGTPPVDCSAVTWTESDSTHVSNDTRWRGFNDCIEIIDFANQNYYQHGCDFSNMEATVTHIP